MARSRSHAAQLGRRLLLLVVLAVLPLAAFVVYGDVNLRRERVADLEAQALVDAKDVARGLEHELESAYQALAGLAQADDIRYGDWAACAARLRGVLVTLERYSNIGFVTPDGNVVCSGVPINGTVNVSDRPWFQRAMTTGRFSIGFHQLGRITNQSSLNVAYPVQGGLSGITGVLSAALDLGELHDNELAGREAGSVLTILDEQGVVIAREPDHELWVGKPANFSLDGGVDRATPFTFYAPGVDGVYRVYGSARVEGFWEGHLVSLSGRSKAVIVADTNRDLAYHVSAVILVGGFAAAGAWSLSHRLIVKGEEARGSLVAIVESSDDAIIGRRKDGTIDSWNKAAERLFGYTHHEAVGRPGSILVPPEDQAHEAVLFQDVVAGKTLAAFEGSRTRKDGKLVRVSVQLAPIRGPSGDVMGASMIARDISVQEEARRELERAKSLAEQTARAKSEFLANMSHEIRTPLNAIIGMTGLLLDTRLSQEQREFTQIVRSSGDHLLTVINDILDISKIEAGAMRLDRQPQLVHRVVEEAIDLVAERAAGKGLELAYEIEDAVPKGLLVDGPRLRQVLVNLLSNAVKFTERGEVAIAVGAKPLRDGRHEVHFAVRDTGVGIPRDKLDVLFKPFSQVDSSATRTQGGTGLGLAISRRIVQLMGGTIWAESEAGKGSTFQFTIRAEEAVALEPEVPAGAVPELAGKHVLIVDDNATNRRILRLQVRSWGMDVLESSGAVPALQLLAGHEPVDLAVLDYSMPDMDGLALARRIRSLQHRADLPLLLLTSLGRRVEDDMEDLRLSAYATKPLRKSELYNALVEALRVEPAPEDRTPTAATPKSDLRILLAEDGPVNRLVALKLLDRMGFHADTVENGREAVKAVQQKTYDVVLMDVQMPEMDGLEATRQIRALGPRSKGPRIIALTAHALEGDREECLRAGMDEYITKPVDPQRLKDALQQTRKVTPMTTTPKPANGGSESKAWMAKLEEDYGPEAAAEIIKAFRTELPGLLTTLETGWSKADLDQVRRASHTLKSSAATIGADALSTLAKDVEALTKAGAKGPIEGPLGKLVAEAQRVGRVLDGTA